MTAIGDIDYVRGDTKPIRLTITGATSGDPVDLTGCSFILTVDPAKAPTDASNNLMALTGVVDADQITNPGKVMFEPSVSDTNHTGTYYYDIQMTDANGYINTFVSGFKFKLGQDITK